MLILQFHNLIYLSRIQGCFCSVYLFVNFYYVTINMKTLCLLGYFSKLFSI